MLQSEYIRAMLLPCAMCVVCLEFALSASLNCVFWIPSCCPRLSRFHNETAVHVVLLAEPFGSVVWQLYNFDIGSGGAVHFFFVFPYAAMQCG